MARRLSTSSFRVGANEIPWPTPAVLVALAVLIVIASVLGYLGGWQFGDPPSRSYPTLSEQALRYNRTISGSNSQIMLLGSSLMRLGVIENQLTKDLGRPDLPVINLAMDGAGPWEELRLLGRLSTPRTSGARVAILEVNRRSFDARLTDDDFERAEVALSSDRASLKASRLTDVVRYVALPSRQSITDWVQEFRYGFLPKVAPKLVATPSTPPRTLWNVDEEEQRRAVRDMTPAVAGRALVGWRFSTENLQALRELVRRLRVRGFRVILLQTPVHSAYLEFWRGAADGAVDEAIWRREVLDPASTGADAVLAIDDAKAMGATDSVFIDYGHLTRDGARLQTALLARFIESKRVLATRTAIDVNTAMSSPGQAHAQAHTSLSDHVSR